MSLVVQKLKFNYTRNEELLFPDIRIKDGEHALLLGPSGSGKTSLLHLIAGLLKPEAGEIKINDTDITSLTAREMDTFRGQKIGIVFQVPYFLRSLNVYENIALAQRLAGKVPNEKRIVTLLEGLGMGHKKLSKTNQLSQGEKQRVSIVRALVNEPSLILADEPTSALDDNNCKAVIEMMKASAEAISASLVVVTHDNRLSSDFSNRIKLGV